jgi:hypothetical protein
MATQTEQKMGVVGDDMPVGELFASLLDYPSIVATAIGWITTFIQGCKFLKGFGKTFLAMAMIVEAAVAIADMDHALDDQCI